MNKLIFFKNETRDANLFDICRIIPIFKADFCITILDIKIPAKNNFITGFVWTLKSP